MDSCTCVHFCICVHVDTFVSVYMCILLCACTLIFCASWTISNVFVLSVYARMQLIVQPMMERGEDKEDGWGEFDCEIFDRKAAYMVELIKGDINSKNGSGEAVIQLNRSMSTKKLKKARKGMR